MPNAAEILAGLTEIANRGIVLAISWHLVLAVVLVSLVRGWRPPGRVARRLLALPLVSVAVLAMIFRNPFNAIMFALGAAALLALSGASTEPVRRGPPWAFWAGVASLSYGWLYPHFLDVDPIAYLVAAPVGLVPCPTLAVVIGVALLGGGLGSRAWSLVLAALGLFYGLFGVFRLGVLLDLGLLLAATVLLLAALTRRSVVPAQLSVVR